jgi:hypothetical protein
MESVATGIQLRSAAVLLTTGGGRNPDVLGAFKKIVAGDPRKFVVLCMSLGAPLARLARAFEFVDYVDTAIPAGKDGFLATNSLLGSTILLARAYAKALAVSLSLPPDLPGLLDACDMSHFLDQCNGRCEPLWRKGTLIVLHGPSTRSGAIDLESKFTEAALGNVQTADYRNFAHGRHHWLAKKGNDSAVIAFLTPDDKKTGSATLKLLPKSIPAVRVMIPFRGIVANLAALVHGLYLVGSAGRARAIDPGRPGVPSFGRRIYHLTASEYGNHQAIDVETVAIQRKTGRSISSLEAENQLTPWRVAYANFLQKLRQTKFRGTVFDYDGTLCGERDRETGPRPAIGRHLFRLVKGGIALGIATGRGKSASKALRKVIPERYWDHVLVGYYNGGDVAPLSDESRPDGTETTCESLVPIANALKADNLLQQLATFEFRIPQIKVEAKTDVFADTVWAHLVQLVYQLSVPGVSVQRSSHSMDVVGPDVTKQNVVDAVSKKIPDVESTAILRIGDRGQWPGNDFVLLSGPSSLSVDEVSQDPATCWNLAPPGLRSVQACLHYLEKIDVTRGAFVFCDLPKRGSTR